MSLSRLFCSSHQHTTCILVFSASAPRFEDTTSGLCPRNNAQPPLSVEFFLLFLPRFFVGSSSSVTFNHLLLRGFPHSADLFIPVYSGSPQRRPTVTPLPWSVNWLIHLFQSFPHQERSQARFGCRFSSKTSPYARDFTRYLPCFGHELPISRHDMGFVPGGFLFLSAQV